MAGAYAQYPPQPSMSVPVREYDIIVRQEPKQARMCGVGGKADRRPIDPPPIVQLRVRDTYPSDPSDPNSARISHPHQSLSFLQNPYYFMFASLARVDSDDELHLLNDGKTRYTTGSVVSSLYHLKDTENGGEDAGFFVFPDLSVRTEGSYRLKLTLFEVVGSHVQFCKSVYSRPFYVYTAKKFPGMEESTPLSMALSDQGIKIRIRKDVRNRKRTADAGEEEENEDDEEEGGGRDHDSEHLPPHPHAMTAAPSGRPTRATGKRKASTGGGARFVDSFTGRGSRGKNNFNVGPNESGSAGPSGAGRPTKRQRTQGGTILDLSQNNAQIPSALASGSRAQPSTSNANTNPSTTSGGGGGGGGGGETEEEGGGSGNDLAKAPIGADGAPDWSHLPPPSIPGGMPIDVSEHPAMRVDPRLKHTVPPGTVSTPPPPAAASGAPGAGATSSASAGSTTTPAPVSASGPGSGSRGDTVVPEQRRNPTLPHSHSHSGVTPTHAHHQHSSSSGSNYAPAPLPAPLPPSSSWAPQPQPPPPPPAPQTPTISSSTQVSEYFPPSRRPPSAHGVSGGGGGMPLPPLQIPHSRHGHGPVSQQPQQGMPMHGYGQYPSAGPSSMASSPPLPSASSMHHQGMPQSMGPPSAHPHVHVHGHARPHEGYAYGHGHNQGMMMPPMQTQPPAGYIPDAGAQYYSQGQMGGYSMHSHSHPISQGVPPGPVPPPTTPTAGGYAQHGHHLSDPHVHAHTLPQPPPSSRSEYSSIPQHQSLPHPGHSHSHSHSHSGSFDYPSSSAGAYGSGPAPPPGAGGPGTEYESSPALMSMTPISPNRMVPQSATPLSAHPAHGIPPQQGPQGQQQGDMYAYSSGQGRDYRFERSGSAYGHGHGSE